MCMSCWKKCLSQNGWHSIENKMQMKRDERRIIKLKKHRAFSFFIRCVLFLPFRKSSCSRIQWTKFSRRAFQMDQLLPSYHTIFSVWSRCCFVQLVAGAGDVCSQVLAQLTCIFSWAVWAIVWYGFDRLTKRFDPLKWILREIQWSKSTVSGSVNTRASWSGRNDANAELLWWIKVLLVI